MANGKWPIEAVAGVSLVAISLSLRLSAARHRITISSHPPNHASAGAEMGLK